LLTHTELESAWFGFNPRAHEAISWFQNLLSKWVSSCRYDADQPEALAEEDKGTPEVRPLYKLNPV
jgi:hypothetical protein